MGTVRANPAAEGHGAWKVGLTGLGGLFYLSGVSGLLYEVVWLRSLTRMFGSTAYATSTVLAVFMSGLGLGGYLAGRFVDRTRRPLLVFAALELGVGVSAVLTLGLPDRLLPLYRALHEWAGGSYAGLTAARAVAAFLVLLPPTVLMGATLPTLCAWVGRRSRHLAEHAGGLYAANTAGAVSGVALAGFVFIGEFGETATVNLGAALNVAVVLGVLSLSRAWEGDDPAPDLAEGPPAPEISVRVRRAILGGVAASGFLAMANEVVWGRMLLLYQGTSVYAFSAMLAVLLAGMGVGGFVGARLADRSRDPLTLFARLQWGTGFAGLAALHLYDLGAAVRPDLTKGSHVATMFVAPVLLLGPLGTFWGMSFPVAVRCLTEGATNAGGGRVVGRLYAWNTFGGVAGAATGGFALLPLLGVSATGTALAAVSFLVGFALLLAHPSGLGRVSRAETAYVAAACAVLAATAGDQYFRLLSRLMERASPGPVTVYQHTEGPAATTTVFGPSGGGPRTRHLWVDGEGMTALVPATKLMAHLPLWLADRPRDLLVICLGMGTTARSASRHEGLSIRVIELVPAVVDSIHYFHPDADAFWRRPNVRVTVDDGRNFLLLSRDRYDVITVDPAPPLYSAGAVNLYSLEFLRLCRERLRPGGVMCLWVPEGNASEVKAIVWTFLEAFEHVSVWDSPGKAGEIAGLYLIGATRPLPDPALRVRAGFRDDAVVEDLREWGDDCDRPEKVLGLLLAGKRELAPLLSGAPVITDDRPYTEFPLWRSIARGGSGREQLNGAKLRVMLLQVDDLLKH